MQAEWKFEDAETKFRDSCKAARSCQPQYIRDNGKVEAVLLSINSELANQILSKKSKPELTFAEFLFTMPKGDWIDDQAANKAVSRKIGIYFMNFIHLISHCGRIYLRDWMDNTGKFLNAEGLPRIMRKQKTIKLFFA